MPSLNEVRLMGHVGKEPETTTLDSGRMVTKFSLATSKHWKKDGEWKSSTTWHNIVTWIEHVPEMHKGDLVLVSGEIDNRSYEKDGTTRYISEINAFRIQWLRPPNKKADDGSPSDEGEGLPF